MPLKTKKPNQSIVSTHLNGLNYYNLSLIILFVTRRDLALIWKNKKKEKKKRKKKEVTTSSSQLKMKS